jgi:N-acetylglucosaminyldiphosphoundecaprenol N-acetyl-beta-D-mannosaminyltransferase
MHGGALAPIESPATVRLRVVDFHSLKLEAYVAHILRGLEIGRRGWVVTINLDHHRRALRDPASAALCARASLRVADGMLTVFASRLQGTRLPARVAGSDLVPALARAAARCGRSLYLLGGAPGAAEGARDVLLAANPTLRIAGLACPEPGFERDPGELERIARALEQAAPDIVLVALGSPKQEILIDRLREQLPRAWWLGVGITLSFLSGHVRRAPRWMQATGLEWLHRLAQEPRRLARRYLVEGIPFAAGLLLVACRERARRRLRRAD